MSKRLARLACGLLGHRWAQGLADPIPLLFGGFWRVHKCERCGRWGYSPARSGEIR
jgi:hypothetical protein